MFVNNLSNKSHTNIVQGGGMSTILQIIDDLQNLTNAKISQSDVARALGITRATVSARVKNESQVTFEEIKKLENAYNISFSEKQTSLKEINKQIDKIKKNLGMDVEDVNFVKICYRPNVFLSAGYGVEVQSESAQLITLDSRLLTTAKGTKINPANCEVVSISGNSMFPEYRHGDRVIIDRGDTELLDGHIFAFRYNGQCFVKEINLLGDKIKCISLNKEYDPFYINKNEDFMVLGRILPRIRL